MGLSIVFIIKTLCHKVYHHSNILLSICNMTRDEPILPANFLEKLDYESKEQNSGKIDGVSR